MLIAWLLLLATSSAACADQSDDPRDWPIATYQSDGGTMLGSAESVQLTDDHGCVVIAKDGHQWLPIFPMPGTSWHDKKVTVHDVTVGLGDVVNMTGGNSQVVPPKSHIPGACKESELFFVLGDVAKP